MATQTTIINDPEYNWYVILDAGPGKALKIESGWEYRADALDQKFDNLPVAQRPISRVLSGSYVKSHGIDPNLNANWILTPPRSRP